MQLELFGKEIGMMYLLSQIFALLATLFSLYAFQKRKKVQILNYTIVAAACGVFHYLFLGAWSGVATKGVGTIRNIIAAREAYHQKTYKIVPLFFVLFYIIAGIITYELPISFLPVIAACIYTVAIYFGDAKKIRYIAALATLLWLIYGIYVGSIVGVLSDVLFIINDSVAIYRYRKIEKNTKKKVKNKNKTKTKTKRR